MFMDRDDYIFEKMEKQKQEIIKRLSLYVGTQYAKDFCCILASAYDYECPVAIRLVDELHLSQKDLYAIEDDFNGYENEWMEDQIHDQVEDQLLDKVMGYYE